MGFGCSGPGYTAAAGWEECPKLYPGFCVLKAPAVPPTMARLCSPVAPRTGLLQESTLVQGQGGPVALQLQNCFIHVCCAGASGQRLEWLLLRDWHRALHPPSWLGTS